MLLLAQKRQAGLFFFTDESTFKERRKRDVISQNVKTKLSHVLRSFVPSLFSSTQSLTDAFIKRFSDNQYLLSILEC
jgi:hypothetical protein